MANSARRIAVWLAVPVLLTAVVGGWYGHAAPAPVRVVRVEKGPIESVIRVTGEVINDRTVTLTALADGLIQRIHVGKGDHVEAGQTVARMDNREATARMHRAEAEVRMARVEVRKHELRLRRLRALEKSGHVSVEDAEAAELAWQGAGARLDISAAALELAQVENERQRIRAPFSGVITDKRTEIGQWVEAGTVLFTLVAQEGWEIEAHVDAADSAAVRLGQRVTLTCDAFPERSWDARIHWISPAINREGENELNTFTVRMGLGQNAPPLLLGQQVDVSIRTAHRDDALKLPFTALVEEEDATTVALVREGRVVYQAVRTGVESFTHAEILEGLAAGQHVILAEGRLPRPGVLVRAAEEVER